MVGKMSNNKNNAHHHQHKYHAEEHFTKFLTKKRKLKVLKTMARPAWNHDNREIAVAFRRDGPFLKIPSHLTRLIYPMSFFVAKTGEIRTIIPKDLGTKASAFGEDRSLRNSALDKMRDGHAECSVCTYELNRDLMGNKQIETRFLSCGHACKYGKREKWDQSVNEDESLKNFSGNPRETEISLKNILIFRTLLLQFTERALSSGTPQRSKMTGTLRVPVVGTQLD